MAGSDTNTDKELHEEAMEAFKLAAEAEDQNRRDFADDLEFAVEEEQWPSEVRKQRELDGRPCLTRNLLGPYIRQVVNDARQNRPSIKVQPADDVADPHTAEVYSGLIRSIENISSADIATDTAVEFATSAGWGYLRVGTEYACDDTFDRDLLIQGVPNPLSIYGDPDTATMDGSDWNSAFEVEKVSEKAFSAQYKDAEKVDWEEQGYSSLDPEWEDTSGPNRRLLVANWWRREKVMRTILLLSDEQVISADIYERNKDQIDALGVTVVGQRQVPSHKVTVTKLSGAEVLEKTRPWAGRYIPIVPVYGHRINIKGRWRVSSLIRSAKGAQQSYNFHHTTAAELTGYAPKAPFIGPKGAFKTDRQKWETANQVSWPYIEYDIVPGMGAPPQRQGFAGVPAGEVAAATQAQADIRSIIGMGEASLGMRSNETSGKAIALRQREGDTATFHIIDNLNRAIRQVGRILIDLIPSVYDQGRVIRVLGPDGSARTVTVGKPQPLTNAEGDTINGPDGLPLTHIFDLSAGKYDLVVSAGPSFTTKREEAAMQMTELIRAYPQAAPLIGDLLAKNLDWPGADEIAKRLKAMLPEQAKGGDSPETVQLKQSMESAQNELQALKRNIEVMQGDRDIKRREVELEAEKVKVDQYNAETNRMRALVGKDGVGLTKEDVMSTVLSTIEQLLNDPDMLTGGPQAPPQDPIAVPPVEPPQELPAPEQPPIPPEAMMAPPEGEQPQG